MAKSLVIDGRTLNAAEIAELNVDWFGWPDAPGGADYEPYGEDVDFAQAQMVAECAEASWYGFCTR